MRDLELSVDLERVRHQINLAHSQLSQQNRLKVKAPNESGTRNSGANFQPCSRMISLKFTFLFNIFKVLTSCNCIQLKSVCCSLCLK